MKIAGALLLAAVAVPGMAQAQVPQIPARLYSA